jgi:glycosyltransferase involved in cell wall biosynthesis
MTVSVLLATTGRPSLAERCIQGVRDTTRGHSVEIIVAVDADPESRDRLTPLADQLLYSSEYRGSSQAWNDCLAASTGDPVVLAADDLIWHPGWLDAALRTLAAFPGGWGFVGFNDGHWGEELSTHWLVSRRLIIEAFGGVITWPCYAHSFQDREANERARQAGRYAWCQDARVEHEHWLFGDRAQDLTDARALGGHGESERVFHQRQAAGFPNDFEAVIQ